LEEHRPARVLVTGGAGFIGSHVVEQLAASGAAVVVVDDFRTSSRENLASVASAVEVVEGDCSTAAALILERGFDTVFHLAAPAYVPPSVEDPVGDLRANVEQTLVMIAAMRAVTDKPRFVHVSSAAVYGQPERQPIAEDAPIAPVSPYGVDKFAAEEHVRVASAIHGFPAVILRFFPVYGRRQTKQVVYDLIRKLMADPARVEVYGTGAELRDLCYVEDVARATLVAARRAPARGEAYNVGSGSMVSIAEVVEAVAAAMGAQPRIEFTGSVRPGDSLRMAADVGALRALGYEPQVSFEDGIARTVAWVTDHVRQEARR